MGIAVPPITSQPDRTRAYIGFICRYNFMSTAMSYLSKYMMRFSKHVCCNHIYFIVDNGTYGSWWCSGARFGCVPTRSHRMQRPKLRVMWDLPSWTLRMRRMAPRWSLRAFQHGLALDEFLDDFLDDFLDYFLDGFRCWTKGLSFRLRIF